MIEEIESAIKEGKIVALEEDRRTGELSIHTFDDDRSLLLAYFAGADTSEKFEYTPRVLFIKEIYEPEPIHQI
ncbi:MAG: hypothetical protein ACKKMS_03415 [Candidatus Nealsonbacteria bacterium]